MAEQKLHIGSHTVRVEVGANDVTFYAEGPNANGDGRFLVMKDGGGHLELRVYHDGDRPGVGRERPSHFSRDLK
jgi:hypothetical protein